MITTGTNEEASSLPSSTSSAAVRPEKSISIKTPPRIVPPESAGYKKGPVIYSEHTDEEITVNLSKTVHLEEMISWLDGYSKEIEVARTEAVATSDENAKKFHDLFAKLGIPAEAFQ